MNTKSVKEIIDPLMKGVHAWVGPAFKTVEQRLNAIDARTKEFHSNEIEECFSVTGTGNLRKALSERISSRLREAAQEPGMTSTKAAAAATAAGMALLCDVFKEQASVIAELQARLEEVERLPFQYEGVHELGREYSKNQITSFDGSMWIALHTTRQRPADGNDWRLCVKRGRDAR